MTDKTKEALKLALAVLEKAEHASRLIDHLGAKLGMSATDLKLDKQTHFALAITAIREALAEQPAQQQTNQSVTPEYLEWLDSIQPRHGVGGNEAWNAGVAWATAQPQQEPVAFLDLSKFSPSASMVYATSFRVNDRQSALYTSPPPSKPWVGLIYKDYEDVEEWVGHIVPEPVFYAIEAKLREKNA